MAGFSLVIHRGEERREKAREGERERGVANHDVPHSTLPIHPTKMPHNCSLAWGNPAQKNEWSKDESQQTRKTGIWHASTKYKWRDNSRFFN